VGFTVYVLYSNENVLSAEVVFVSLALFNILEKSVYAIPSITATYLFPVSTKVILPRFFSNSFTTEDDKLKIETVKHNYDIMKSYG